MAWQIPAAMAAGAVLSHMSGEKQVAEQRKGRKAYEQQLADAQARIDAVDLPDLREYDLPSYDNLFQYDPETLQAIQQQQSSLSTFEGDPRFQQAQIDALRQMSELSEGGLTEGDRLAMTEAQIDASRADRGRQEAILQALARRGMGGSGQELAARLASSQQAADQAASMQRSQLQGAQQRALAALAQKGDLAGSMRGQEFSEAARRAAAADAINRFNVQNRMGAQQANVEARNRAQIMRSQAAQQVANMNRDVAADQLAQRNALQQQQFANQMSKATGGPAVTADAARMRADEAKARSQMIGQGIQSGIGAATAFYGASQRNPMSQADQNYWNERDRQLGAGTQGPATGPGY